MRIHLGWPGLQIPLLSGFGGAAERYTALTMLHGSLMVFLVLTTAPQAGFGKLFPAAANWGRAEMAFPVMNLVFLLGHRYLVCWDDHSVFLSAPMRGLTLWAASVYSLLALAALLTALNFTVYPRSICAPRA